MAPAEPFPYASRTSGHNLRELQRYGWGLFLAPTSRPRTPVEGMRYAIDNGAWFAHVTGTDFDADAFLRLVEESGEGADFIVCPDIVAGGLESLAFSLDWRARLDGLPLLLAVQDGMEPADVLPHLEGFAGLFVGGSTEWKEATMGRLWGPIAQSLGLWLHIGRVNTARRIHMCALAGATSFDGSAASRFSSVLPRLDAARRQQCLAL